MAPIPGGQLFLTRLGILPVQPDGAAWLGQERYSNDRQTLMAVGRKVCSTHSRKATMGRYRRVRWRWIHRAISMELRSVAAKAPMAPCIASHHRWRGHGAKPYFIHLLAALTGSA